MAGIPTKWPPERVEAELKPALRASRTMQEAANRLGQSEPALRGICRYHQIPYRSMLGTATGEQAPDPKREIRELRAEVKKLREEKLTDDRVRQEIIKLRDAPVKPPDWLIETTKAKSGPGVPCLLATDWHWWEVVDPAQIGGVNRYNKEIAHVRARAFFSNAIDLLTQHMVRPEYPGIVLALGGDMLSGEIHDELAATNEGPALASLLDLFGVLSKGIESLAERFGSVFVPAVAGNHGRLTKKTWAKGRAHTNLDWLLYSFLAKRFENDKRVAFQIPDGPDALFQVYGHRFLLTHGDTLGKGGDGIIGALGPILRGDTRKRSRNAQIDQGYDTLVIGHWHQLIQMQRVIVGGSLKGYDEFANSWNLPFEQPRQALWLVHPTRGITFSMPVHVDEAKVRRAATEWVTWSEAQAA
jgi:predicted phosphodiesterase